MASLESGNTVPICNLPENNRTAEMREVFAAIHKKEPDFYVRVPGRVNLIGEHIDYCGYSVCPMALEQDIFLAVSIEDDQKLFLHNLESKYEDYECDLRHFEITVGEGSPNWHQYFLCGVKGLLEILTKDQPIHGMRIVVGGSVPQSAGLSSSSALVSAAALATSHSHGLAISKEKMASLCAECERYIGTQGGGMDQAIAFLATKGCAKLIEFSPLRSTDIVLPSGAVFVIAHSLTRLNKAATADFNCRVIECRLAAQMIAVERGLEWSKIKKLGDIQHALSVDLDAMIALVKDTLHERPYSKQEVIEKLRTTSDLLEGTSLTPNTRHIESFKLRQRALHVFQEAARVKRFVEVCSNSDCSDTSATLKTLGRLMTDSHDSLRDLYECSHPRLDTLVEMSKGYTLGTRLTGAGWGGCTVSLVLPDRVEKYMEFLKEKFYKDVQDGEFESILFSTSPQGGACIYSCD